MSQVVKLSTQQEKVNSQYYFESISASNWVGESDLPQVYEFENEYNATQSKEGGAGFKAYS